MIQTKLLFKKAIPNRRIFAGIWFNAQSGSTESPSKTDDGSEVFLNVYDLNDTAAKLNAYAKQWNMGAFHVGVEVYGEEYSYGGTEDSVTGVSVTKPKEHEVHKFRESVSLGKTHFTREQLREYVTSISDDWMGPDYHILNKNCITFADTLATFLGVEPLPEWIHGLSTNASKIAENVQAFGERMGFGNAVGQFEQYLAKGDFLGSIKAVMASKGGPAGGK